MADVDEVIVRKRRGLSSEGARWVRQSGHNDALEFAIAIGKEKDYRNDLKAKKDVTDPSEDAHSVKSGLVKWQIFLYGQKRFEEDEAFRTMNGIGDLLIDCINSFPQTYDEYQADKLTAKQQLQIPMRALMAKLSDRQRLRAFLSKAFFNFGEVQYLTIKHKGVFHVFLNNDVLDVLSAELEVDNSQARNRGQMAAQKVVFKYKGINMMELEMRNESKKHYREVRFLMSIPKAMDLLLDKIPETGEYKNRVAKIVVHGNASKKFGRWSKKS